MLAIRQPHHAPTVGACGSSSAQPVQPKVVTVSTQVIAAAQDQQPRFANTSPKVQRPTDQEINDFSKKFEEALTRIHAERRGKPVSVTEPTLLSTRE